MRVWPEFTTVICTFCAEWKAMRFRLWLDAGLPEPPEDEPPEPYWLFGGRPTPGSGRRATYKGPNGEAIPLPAYNDMRL